MRKLALVCLIQPYLAWADGEWTQYKGSFQDVTFPGQQRVVTTQDVSVFLPFRTLAKGNPGPQGRLLIFGKSYPIKNAYQTQTQLVYLASKGQSSVVLLLPAPPPQKLEEQTAWPWSLRWCSICRSGPRPADILEWARRVRRLAPVPGCAEAGAGWPGVDRQG